MPATNRLRAPYEVLCQLFGHPQHHPDSGERVAWDVDVDGQRIRIVDEGKLNRAGARTFDGTMFDAPNATWSVAGSDDKKLVDACKTISVRVIAAVAKQSGARTLSADDKVLLNQLVRDGLPLGEAMKQVRTRLADDGARAAYAWPIVEVVLPLTGKAAAAPKPTRAGEEGEGGEGDEGEGEGGEGDEGDEGDEGAGGDDVGDADVSDDDDRPAPAPKATRPASRAKPPAYDGDVDMGGQLSGLARLLGALKTTPAAKPAVAAKPSAPTAAAKPPAAATKPAQPAAKPAADPPSAKPAPAPKPMAAKPMAAKPTAAKPTATKPAAKPAAPAAKKPAPKKPAAKPALKRPAAKPAAKKPAAKKR